MGEIFSVEEEHVIRKWAREEAEAVRAREVGEELAEIKEEQNDADVGD